ncbi:glycoside hydrolase family 76 protein [Baudoinia panamericana UAMH 10762]|uniref:Mannan endo-1,6-alpha-mannosidase n=1 Tax=Baudoinia panamericana (strain UAMH 10762) TaxID=717646 RepID=M2MHW2_BAUPA|nr:glycoside hydrolase family 76 protein [Baudoinia panamericana UAMH 10762]EMC96226.1 glycoside hydrolase family 76 protein [Baudoinia panamericana UAMH 10762]
MRYISSPVLLLSYVLRSCSALTLDPMSASSIKSVASTVAYGMMKYYSGNETGGTPGLLPQPYYWWEAGSMCMTMIDYWYYTGDTSYNDAITQAITFQASSYGNFMPANQTATEGNDDQVFWAYAAMTAAELNYPAPPPNYPSWLAMAQAVFNEQASRWDTSTCNGGLRWQIYPTNSGYNYKNIAATGGFFMLASRLARYTGNQTYIDWATESWDWFSASVLFDERTYQIYDGTDDTANCTAADHTQWSYNYGFFIGGLAFLYNQTEDAKWLTPLSGILNQTIATFFPKTMGNKIMVEVTCEPLGNCDTDNFTFKGYVLRWMAVAAQLAPSTANTIWPYIMASGTGAAGQCDGGTDGVTCGFRWNSTKWDDTYGVGQQMSALSAIGANMIPLANLKAPYTSSTGGTSVSDPSAGNSDASTGESAVYTDTITTADKAGAAILTVLAVLGTLAVAWFIVT